MMGRLKGDQGQFFYSFCLDDVVPDDHRVCEIAAVLDLSWVHTELAIAGNSRWHVQDAHPCADLSAAGTNALKPPL